MGKVYDIQDYLRISATYTTDIKGNINSVKLKYIDPEGVEGEWDANHDTVSKTIYYDLPQGTPLGKAGTWTVWSFLTFEDGRVIPGNPFKFRILEEGRL